MHLIHGNSNLFHHTTILIDNYYNQPPANEQFDIEDQKLKTTVLTIKKLPTDIQTIVLYYIGETSSDYYRIRLIVSDLSAQIFALYRMQQLKLDTHVLKQIKSYEEAKPNTVNIKHQAYLHIFPERALLRNRFQVMLNKLPWSSKKTLIKLTIQHIKSYNQVSKRNLIIEKASWIASNILTHFVVAAALGFITASAVAYIFAKVFKIITPYIIHSMEHTLKLATPNVLSATSLANIIYILVYRQIFKIQLIVAYFTICITIYSIWLVFKHSVSVSESGGEYIRSFHQQHMLYIAQEAWVAEITTHPEYS